MAEGQLRVLRAREPIADLLQDPGTPAEERERLGLVLEARDFARGLGLDVGQQYTSYAPWPGDRLVTAVVAAKPGSLETADFWFPLLGSVPYKGYFDTTLAEAEAAELRARGLDTCLVLVPAYSTLGWLADPVTGPLLRAPAPDLVATVIHELVHATVYVPGDADWNEGLATFVGQEASVQFFEERGGRASEGARLARERVSDQRALSAAMRALREDVAALYARAAAGPAREAEREALSAAARRRIAALPLATLDAEVAADRLRTNDACLALEGTYAADLPRYDALFARVGGDLRRLLQEARAAADAGDPRGRLFGESGQAAGDPSGGALLPQDPPAGSR